MSEIKGLNNNQTHQKIRLQRKEGSPCATSLVHNGAWLPMIELDMLEDDRSSMGFIEGLLP